MPIDGTEKVEAENLHILREARYMYLSGLLSFNGILLATFAIIASLNPTHKYLFAFLILSSIISAILVVWNFRATKGEFATIDFLGKNLPPAIADSLKIPQETLGQLKKVEKSSTPRK